MDDGRKTTVWRRFRGFTPVLLNFREKLLSSESFSKKFNKKNELGRYDGVLAGFFDLTKSITPKNEKPGRYDRALAGFFDLAKRPIL